MIAGIAIGNCHFIAPDQQAQNSVYVFQVYKVWKQADHGELPSRSASFGSMTSGSRLAAVLPTMPACWKKSYGLTCRGCIDIQFLVRTLRMHRARLSYKQRPCPTEAQIKENQFEWRRSNEMACATPDIHWCGEHFHKEYREWEFVVFPWPHPQRSR